MRTLVCVITFVILLLIGFLATPGLFKIVNPEYLLALRESGTPLAKLALDANDIDTSITGLESKISELQKSIIDVAIASSAKQSSMKSCERAES